MMFYFGEPGTGTELPASLSGRFTDQGVAGESTVGKSLGMRTAIANQRCLLSTSRRWGDW
jgi:hypothetical protein